MATRSHDGDQDGEDNDEDLDDDDGSSGSIPVRQSLGDRIRSGLQPSTNGRSGSTDRATPSRPDPQSTKRTVERLDDRERLFCFAASALAVIAGIAIYFVEHENKHYRHVKGQLTPETTLVLGFVVGALLLGATLVGRRAPVGFVALFGFLFFGTQYLAGIPFLVLAVWLLVRSYKIQKEAAAARKAALAEGTSSARSGARGRRGSATTASAKSGTAKSSSKGPTTAEANKRYTPKRPAPPPPKPSRRDRKAARTSD